MHARRLSFLKNSIFNQTKLILLPHLDTFRFVPRRVENSLFCFTNRWKFAVFFYKEFEFCCYLPQRVGRTFVVNHKFEEKMIAVHYRMRLPIW